VHRRVQIIIHSRSPSHPHLIPPALHSVLSTRFTTKPLSILLWKRSVSCQNGRIRLRLDQAGVIPYRAPTIRRRCHTARSARQPTRRQRKYIYDIFQFKSNVFNKTYSIKARFTKGVSTGAVLRVFDTHDAASEHLQEIQLELLGGDWGDTEKARVHLKVEPYSGDYWYLQVVEAVVPGQGINPSAWGSAMVSCEIFEPEARIQAFR
jgi:hypothetical protein